MTENEPVAYVAALLRSLRPDCFASDEDVAELATILLLSLEAYRQSIGGDAGPLKPVLGDADELALADECLCDPVAALRRARLREAARRKATARSRSAPKPRRKTRAEAANTAADLGLDGFGWSDDDGTLRHVRYSGTVISFD